MIYKDIAFAIKAIDDGAGFEGHASVFSTIDRVGDIVVPGAFKDTIPQFLEDGVVVWQHQWSEPIGKPTQAREDEKGLFIAATISDTVKGRDARTLMKDNVVKKLSFGYDILECERLNAENIANYTDISKATPKQLEEAFRWGYALKRLHLYEVSPVSVPAHPDADISGVKGNPPRDGGRLMDEHSGAVLATVKDYIDRLEGLAAKREQLSDEHMARLKALLAGVDGARVRIETLLKTSGPSVSQDDVLQAHARFLELESRLVAGRQ